MTKDIFAICKENAESQLQIMREVANELFRDRADLIIGVNGSVARREYTSGSDIDHFLLSTVCNCVDLSKEEGDFQKALEAKGLKMPAAGGVFEGSLFKDKLLSPIGGEDDTNKTLTRRMLFLLEGEWIFNKEAFEDLRESLIATYVSDRVEDNRLALYLLNDIIRYWRTICVDFEYKTSGGKKPRALRLAKLRMSRMLLCFAGFVAVSKAVNLTTEEKRKRLVDLFSMQAIPRMDELLGSHFSKAKGFYGDFLSKLDDSDFRAVLAQEGDEGMDTQQYQEMSRLARSFKNELIDILLNDQNENAQVIKAILL